MRYTADRKQQTRRRIVEIAARAFRAKGVDGVAIPALMREAGLTHGGFYAHFPSKEALVAEACAAGIRDNAAALAERARAAPPGGALAAFVDGYLTAAHRDRPERGCLLAAVAGDLAREPADVRAAFTAALGDYAAAVGPVLREADPAAGDDDALALLASLAGGLLLARAVADPDLSDRILAASRRLAKRACASHQSTPEATE